ncbi:UNVERIFIED_ORG: hypothetical protein J2W87_000173 [Pseudomonas putida]|nr:hypothetical protein [Pseudomonas putida]
MLAKAVCQSTLILNVSQHLPTSLLPQVLCPVSEGGVGYQNLICHCPQPVIADVAVPDPRCMAWGDADIQASILLRFYRKETHFYAIYCIFGQPAAVYMHCFAVVSLLKWRKVV